MCLPVFWIQFSKIATKLKFLNQSHSPAPLPLPLAPQHVEGGGGGTNNLVSVSPIRSEINLNIAPVRDLKSNFFRGTASQEDICVLVQQEIPNPQEYIRDVICISELKYYNLESPTPQVPFDFNWEEVSSPLIEIQRRSAEAGETLVAVSAKLAELLATTSPETLTGLSNLAG